MWTQVGKGRAEWTGRLGLPYVMYSDYQLYNRWPVETTRKHGELSSGHCGDQDAWDGIYTYN